MSHHGILLLTLQSTAYCALTAALETSWPSVSVQMVTYKRSHLLLEALEQVRWQDYEGPLEVVIIDDSPEPNEHIEAIRVKRGAMSGVHSSIPVHYIYLEQRMSIGAKRNLATRSTTAEILCIWDDDDVFTMDRIRKQVEHLHSGVNCSGIEVASFYSVPDEELSVRPIGLEPIVFENTLCFFRRWWESGRFGFGESWEVSGQGEGTLEAWWRDVKALSGAEEPFLYIYLPSSASGGTALNKNRSPPPCSKLTALCRALHPSSSRFPSQHGGVHVSTAIEVARREVETLLQMPGLMSVDPDPSLTCRPVESLIRRRSVNDATTQLLLAQYPESDRVSTDRLDVAERVWSTLSHSASVDAGWMLMDGPPLRIMENLLQEEEVSELLAAVKLDAFGRRDRGSLDASRCPGLQALKDRLAKALGVEVTYLEPVRVVHYGRPDQAFEEHVDWIVDPEDPQLLTFGQRIASALVFLSDLPPGVGGETDFPVLGLSVTPKKGTTLLWPNVAKDGRPLPELIHEAKPMKCENLQKTALNVWVRDRPLPTDPAILESLLQS